MKLSKFVKTPLNVALRKTEVENLLLPRVILRFKKRKAIILLKIKCKLKIFMSSVHISSERQQMIFGLKQNKYAVNISSVYNRFKIWWTIIKPKFFVMA